MIPMQTVGIFIAWKQVEEGLEKGQLFDGVL